MEFQVKQQYRVTISLDAPHTTATLPAGKYEIVRFNSRYSALTLVNLLTDERHVWSSEHFEQALEVGLVRRVA